MDVNTKWTLLQEHGHQVLRLPPYHCDLNPIELIWVDLNQYVASNKSTFKSSDVRQQIKGGFSQMDKAKWEKICQHVRSNMEN